MWRFLMILSVLAVGCGTDDEAPAPEDTGAFAEVAVADVADVAVVPDAGATPDPGPATDLPIPDTNTPPDADPANDPGSPPEDTGPADVDEPDEGQPPEDVGPEDTSAPDTSEADTSEADTTEPDTSEPDTSEPDTGDGGCTLHVDCPQPDLCTKPWCTDGECTTQEASCDDSNACTTDSCDPALGCVNVWDGDGCNAPTVLFEAHFDDLTSSGLTVEPTGDAQWWPDPALTWYGAGALYFGIPGPYHYDTGMIVSSTATTPLIPLEAGKSAQLAMAVWMDVESGSDWDSLSVVVHTDAGTVPVWSKDDDNVLMAQWQIIAVDLSAYAGQSITIAVGFDTIDDTFNETYGAVIDAIFVTSAEAKSCESAADCDDGIACTEDTCVDSVCTYAAASGCCVTAADCTDGDACTVDSCGSDNTCASVAVADPLCCNLGSDCDDGNACTVDSCEGAICTFAPSEAEGCCSNDAGCNDSESCTIDTCTDFTCSYVNTCCQSDAECNDGDDICTTDSCVGGACQYALLPVPGCCEPVLLTQNFDEGAPAGWTLGDDGTGCKWSVQSSGQKKSLPSALYYGNPLLKTVECLFNGGSAVTPTIEVPNKSGVSLTFDMWQNMDTLFDQFSIVINGTTVFDNLALPVASAWSLQTIPLDAYAGQTVSIQFVYAGLGIPGIFEIFEGLYLDNIQVTDPCE